MRPRASEPLARLSGVLVWGDKHQMSDRVWYVGFLGWEPYAGKIGTILSWLDSIVEKCYIIQLHHKSSSLFFHSRFLVPTFIPLQLLPIRLALPQVFKSPTSTTVVTSLRSHVFRERRSNKHYNYESVPISYIERKGWASHTRWAWGPDVLSSWLWWPRFGPRPSPVSHWQQKYHSTYTDISSEKPRPVSALH